jgi:hypothetical protein
MSAIDDAWLSVIEEFDLDETIRVNGVAKVAASDLNRFRQARLMAKFDHSVSLPSSLKSRGWAVLGISNSEYLVGPLTVFQELPRATHADEVRFIEPRRDLETLDPSNISSESDAILLAHAAGILDDFIGEPTTFTTFGRMRSETFEFTIENKLTGSTSVSVSGTQIEIDGGFEGTNTFSVIECKNHPSDDFNLRQLYYPYRAWSDRISKLVSPIFMIYANDIFDLYKYEFEYPDDINSGVVIDHGRYSVIDVRLSLQVLFGFANNTVKNQNLIGPFPQADSFERVLDLVSKCNGKRIDKNEIADIYNFDSRQADYYSSAAKFLGLLEERDGGLYRTNMANSIWESEGNAKYMKLASLLLSVGPISETFIHGNRFTRAGFSTAYAQEALGRSIYGQSLGESTLSRRAKTIVNWCQWLDSLVRH